jgi:hypothetical protein
MGVDLKDLEVPPGLGKERPREGAARPKRRGSGVACGSAGGAAVSFSVTDWQRLTEIISKILNRSAQSDE